MKSSIIACVLLLLVLFEDGNSEKPQVRVVEYRNERKDNGYYFKFATNDGQSREETGELLTKGDEEILSVRGSFSFITPDKKLVITRYVSDENGYRAKQEIKQLYDVPAQAVSSLAGGGFPI